ncbi:MAG: aspartyl protease family protein [Acidobacteriota bacterium]|nr:MAG: aspartyl protease family protein [Acidobacteriota bacterium]
MKTTVATFLVGLVGIHLSAFGLSAERLQGVIPFEMHEHLIVVKVSFQNQGAFHFAIDTGSSYTVISNRLGKKLRLQGETIQVSSWGESIRCQKVTLPNLELGNVHFDQVEAHITDLPAIRGLELDGLIGLDLLKRTTITIDFQSKAIRFGQVDRLQNSASFYRGLPFLPITLAVAGKPLRVILDTGSAGLVLYEEAVRGRIEFKTNGKTEYRPHAGGRVKLKQASVRQVTLGETLWDELPALLLTGTRSGNQHAMGNLGVTSLRLALLHLDFQAGRLSWER